MQTRQPRTAVGLDAAGHRVVFLVADGRRPDAAGMTAWEMVDAFVAEGITEAMNLDGGGSSTLWIDGVVVNRPSDGRERAVANALVVREASRASGVAP